MKFGTAVETPGARAKKPGQNVFDSTKKNSSVSRTSSATQPEGSGGAVVVAIAVAVAVAVAVLVEVVVAVLTILSKQLQALLIPGVGTFNMKFGTAVETPGARAKKPGQNAFDSTKKNSRVSSTLSATQPAGKGRDVEVAEDVVVRAVLVGVPVAEGVNVTPAILPKQSQALLMLGVGSLRIKFGTAVETPGASARNPGQKSPASNEKNCRVPSRLSATQPVGRGRDVEVTEDVVVGAVLVGVSVAEGVNVTPAILPKQSQALLMLGVGSLRIKFGMAVETPGASARNPGQKSPASNEKNCRVPRRLSATQPVGRGRDVEVAEDVVVAAVLVGVPVAEGVNVTPAILSKQPQALLMLGVGSLRTKFGTAVETPGARARNPGQNSFDSIEKNCRVRRRLSRTQPVGRGATVEVAEDVVVLAVLIILSKQLQALLMLGVGSLRMKFGTAVETPGARARNPGQKSLDSTMKNLRVLSRLSALQPAGRASTVEVAEDVVVAVVASTVEVAEDVVVAVVLAVLMILSKQLQALLMLGVGSLRMKFGTAVETPGARARNPGQKSLDSNEKNCRVPRRLSATQPVGRGAIVEVADDVAVRDVAPVFAILSKQLQALLMLGVGSLRMKFGTAVETPGASARNPGQKSRDSKEKNCRVPRRLSATQPDGRGTTVDVLGDGVVAAVAATILWKQEQALLTPGVGTLRMKFGKGVEAPGARARNPGQN